MGDDDIYQTQQDVGSPRGSPALDPSSKVPQPQKRRRGRPRKIVLSDEEEERENRGKGGGGDDPEDFEPPPPLPTKRIAKRKRRTTTTHMGGSSAVHQGKEKEKEKEKEREKEKRKEMASPGRPSPRNLKRARALEEAAELHKTFRKRLLRSTVDRLTFFHAVPDARVLHALWAFSGDVAKANDFLSGKVTARPWERREDLALYNNQNVAGLIERRGSANVIARINFLSC